MLIINVEITKTIDKEKCKKQQKKSKDRKEQGNQEL